MMVAKKIVAASLAVTSSSAFTTSRSAPHGRRVGLGSSTLESRSDPAIRTMVAEASAKSFVPVPLIHRTAVWGAAGSAGVLMADDALPAPLRALVGSVLIFSNFEYFFHRFVMHAPPGGALETYQDLHVTHHVETGRDQSLDGGADTDPRHIYFSGTTTLASILISTLGLEALTGVFDLGFDPATSLGISALVALLHTSIWQTLHGDIHEYYSEYPGALPRADVLSTDSPYTRWLVENHVGHHLVGGKGNYNIVFPGPDYLWGTCFQPER